MNLLSTFQADERKEGAVLHFQSNSVIDVDDDSSDIHKWKPSTGKRKKPKQKKTKVRDSKEDYVMDTEQVS